MHLSRLFMDFMAAKGMQKDGGVDFIISRNKAYLIDNNLGRMTGTHAPLFFQKRHFPEAAFAYYEPDLSSRDVFDVWEILQSKGLALDLKRGTGVFPISYLPGISAEMMAFAPTVHEAYDLMEKTQGLLN